MSVNPEEQTEEKKVNVRHTITAEETFTLAKDVFDIRCFIKNVYSNRAVIMRRLNILSLSISAFFTLLYVGYVLLTALTKKLDYGVDIVLYALLGVYAALLITLFIVSICAGRSKTKSVFKIKRTLTVFKILVRLVSIALSIMAIALSVPDGKTAAGTAVDIIIIVISILMLVLQIVPLLCGGVGRLARWLLSPVKIKYRFSAVALEWYELVISGKSIGSSKRVASRYFDDIGVLIDNYIIPAIGKKYINSIKAATLLNLAAGADESDRPIVEGILKSVFAYSAESGYVTFDPCKDLDFEGSVEEEEKQSKPTLKGKLFNVGKKIGKSVIDKYVIGEGEPKKE